MSLLTTNTSICMGCVKRLHSLLKHRPASTILTKKYVSSRPLEYQFEPVPDLEYLLDPANLQIIRDNIKNRKGVGNIDELVSSMCVCVSSNIVIL